DEETFAPTLQQSPAGRIELEQRRIGAANDDDVTGSVEVNSDDLPGKLLGRALRPIHPGRELDPALGGTVRVRLRVWTVDRFLAGARTLSAERHTSHDGKQCHDKDHELSPFCRLYRMLP